MKTERHRNKYQSITFNISNPESPCWCCIQEDFKTFLNFVPFTSCKATQKADTFLRFSRPFLEIVFEFQRPFGRVVGLKIFLLELQISCSWTAKNLDVFLCLLCYLKAVDMTSMRTYRSARSWFLPEALFLLYHSVCT